MRKYGTPYLRIMWVRILNVILKHYDKKRKASSMEKLLMSFNLPDQIQSASEIQQRITDIIMECVRAEAVNDMNARSKIQMAVRYIQEHYSEDIAINDLAMSYGMSPNYFSSVFKAETSQSAVNYITELKVKKKHRNCLRIRNSAWWISQSGPDMKTVSISSVYSKKTHRYDSSWLSGTKQDIKRETPLNFVESLLKKTVFFLLYQPYQVFSIPLRTFKLQF